MPSWTSWACLGWASTATTCTPTIAAAEPAGDRGSRRAGRRRGDRRAQRAPPPARRVAAAAREQAFASGRSPASRGLTCAFAHAVLPGANALTRPPRTVTMGRGGGRAPPETALGLPINGAPTSCTSERRLPRVWGRKPSEGSSASAPREEDRESIGSGISQHGWVASDERRHHLSAVVRDSGRTQQETRSTGSQGGWCIQSANKKQSETVTFL
jgi:hypothetical protein